MTETMTFTELARSRWSPRAYQSSVRVEPEALQEIFEAARWAQSSYNEQPWRFLISEQESPGRAALEDCLDCGNAFAREAWVLGIVYARMIFAKNGQPNPHAVFDAGAASQILALKAFESGLHTRFMAGFSREKAGRLAPAGFEPLAMFVIGRATPGALQTRPERRRKPREEILFKDVWP